MKCCKKIRVPCLVFLGLFWGFLLLTPAGASEGDNGASASTIDIHLIISRNIRPYLEASEALRASLKASLEANIHVYDLFRYKGNARKSLAKQLGEKGQGALFIAIGPEATAFLWQDADPPDGGKLYSIVLNPESVSPDVSPDCGISLNIPPSVQLAAIGRSLPEAPRIGVFYDPQYNQDFFARADRAANVQGIRVMPLQVSSKKEIPGVFSASIKELDAIWLIPDRTVISESIAQYIIKQSILHGVPVIGYNQFFYESGAAAAFVFDYAALGRQTARMAINFLAEGQCRYQVPEFEVWINPSVYEKLGIPRPEPDKQLVVGP